MIVRLIIGHAKFYPGEEVYVQQTDAHIKPRPRLTSMRFDMGKSPGKQVRV